MKECGGHERRNMEENRRNLSTADKDAELSACKRKGHPTGGSMETAPRPDALYRRQHFSQLKYSTRTLLNI
jgi:hypothetical protein